MCIYGQNACPQPPRLIRNKADGSAQRLSLEADAGDVVVLGRRWRKPLAVHEVPAQPVVRVVRQYLRAEQRRR